jgi:hypothetical protein
MVYRDDVGALEARLETLESELAAKIRQRDEAARLVVEAKARARNDALAADWAAGGPQRRKRQRVALIVSAVMALTAAIGLFWKFHFSVDLAQERLDRAVAQFERYTDDICACKDSACAEGVTKQMTAWAAEMAKEEPHPRPGDIDKATMERMQAIGTRMSECMTKVLSPPVD